MVTPPFDVAVVGGGIVGLATLMEAASGPAPSRALLLEKEPRLASHQTGHNSGVIHSGIYYRPGSARAAACVEGGARLLRFLETEGLPHRVCGKVVVATTAGELPALRELMRRGEANGVAGLRLLDPAALREIEPHAAGVAALHVPGAAITDYGAVAARFARKAAVDGARIVTGAQVVALRREGGATRLITTAGEFSARVLINCAGLHSDRVASMAGMATGLIIAPFRGEYRTLSPKGSARVRGLIYPVPDPAFPFLGIHLTPRLDGSVEAGPTAVLALAREGYRRGDLSATDLVELLCFPGFWRMARRHWRTGLAEARRNLSRRAFLAALRRLVPALEDEDLLAGGAGVRAQALDRSGALLDDFRIDVDAGAIHVLNVPSPAATACLAIARRVLEAGRQAGVLS